MQRIALAFLTAASIVAAIPAFAQIAPTGTVAGVNLSDWTPGEAAGVPEPAAWGMMAGGFALAGLTLRRRIRTKVVFT